MKREEARTRRQREQCTMLRSAILDLMDWRLQLMTGTFTLDHLRDLRLRITSHIDSGNRAKLQK
ncbi:hypothetical protein OUZ56_024415 [Daphnia magna]|uniref:Dedicator of cytokinesis N-terminal domain-containing protein n=1 Tax=Daphnia magna TaxID=35525 RepID=A0ABR0B0S7_9CRUS|nr:hypothetical protein OUZ56_024415 [Daphnia magna]